MRAGRYPSVSICVWVGVFDNHGRPLVSRYLRIGIVKEESERLTKVTKLEGGI